MRERAFTLSGRALQRGRGGGRGAAAAALSLSADTHYRIGPAGSACFTRSNKTGRCRNPSRKSVQSFGHFSRTLNAVLAACLHKEHGGGSSSSQ